MATSIPTSVWEDLEPRYAGGTPGTAAAVRRVPGDDKAGRDDDILEKILSRLSDKIEAFIKTQRMGGAPAVLPKRNRKGLDGFRVGFSHDPRVGFDPGAKKAQAPRLLLTASQWRTAHLRYCTRTLALCQVYQAAADSGPQDAFAAAVEQHGAPDVVVKAGAASGGVDISAYGFGVVGQQVVPRQTHVQDGLMAHISVPAEEFPGGVELMPVRNAVTRTVPSVALCAPISAVREFLT
ncbi:hypothetical protein CYMTET_57073 [Cymbomonas tetramitiformis]|uniref:Uncharacterized protein n=1 Tax=Cymbomonas tetramitiformis TaxID=36881 RepID=A0AAE0ELM7_9CHLO|nr:hypothetical protein CYMTET_57073 [Cymbomonas tetramitiformis]